MLTIAMLVAMGRAHEVRVHVMGAVNNGVTREQIREIMIHSAIYCGVPSAVDGLRNAREVLDELELLDERRTGARRVGLHRTRQHGLADGAQPG